MRIAILGGTGDIGEGLALRWAFCSNHKVVIGSRDPKRARTKAEEYETELASRGVDVTINGFDNAMAADRGDVIVLAVPPYHVAATIEDVADKLGDDDVLVSPAVGMKRDEDGVHYHRPSAGSVTRLAADAAPEDVAVVGVFHTLSADRLANLDRDLEMDAPIVADDDDAKEIVTMLAEDIEGLRVLDAGPIANAPEVEALAPLLVNVATNNEGLFDLGVVFT